MSATTTSIRGKKTATHLSWSVLDLVADQPLPGDLFLVIRHRLIRLRGKGDMISRAEFDKFIYNRVECVFIDKNDLKSFLLWIEGYAKDEKEQIFAGAAAENKPVLEASIEMRRTALDLFGTPKGGAEMQAAVESSQRMVTELLKRPGVVENLSHMQRYGRGCVDHAVNVAVLSSYLGAQMGYTSQHILEHLALGGLLHDLGKSFMEPGTEERLLEADDPEYQRHPLLGVQALEKQGAEIADISNEVRMIIAQHHELMDGSGYPNGLQGLSIYELTRIVAIANVFDNLVSEATGEMRERQETALARMETDFVGKLDRKKLEKTVKILRKTLVG